MGMKVIEAKLVQERFLHNLMREQERFYPDYFQ
jgi:hypothetical protein